MIRLLAQQSLDSDTGDANSPLLSQQLSVFSNHPSHLCHTLISDLMCWLDSTQEHLLSFMKEHFLKGLSPATFLLLISDEAVNPSEDSKLFEDNATLLHSVFLPEKKASGKDSFAEKSFECII